MDDIKVENQLVVGLDIGDKRTHFAVLDGTGKLTEEGSVPTNPDSFERTFGRFEAATITLEVGPHSRWSSQLLSDLGHLVYVANPRQLKLIYGSTDKDDRLDAERLARITRLDSTLLHPVMHRNNEAQADLEVLKARNVLVETRTKMINHIRGVLKGFGVKIKATSARFAASVLEVVPEPLKPALLPLIEALQDISTRIKEADKNVQYLCCEKYQKESDLLQQVNGVGPIVSLNYLLRLGNPNRFNKSRDVGAYLGLRPRRSESGDSSPELRITKAGDSMLRALLVQSAQYILGPFGKECDIRIWGLKKAEGSRRAKKRAVVAVARKLSVLLHRLLVTGEVYDPKRNSAAQAA